MTDRITRFFSWLYDDEATAAQSGQDVYDNQAQHTHELLERLAREVEPEALIQRDEILAKCKAEYERDLSGSQFDCSTWGEFLRISIARLHNPDEPELSIFGSAGKPERRYSTALNMSNLGAVRLVEGNPPDCSGTLTYGYSLPYDDGQGRTICGTGFGNYIAPSGTRWEVAPNYPYIPHSRPLFFMASPPDSRRNNATYISDTSYRIKYSTPNFPRAAADDRIIFDGLAATLFVPFGKGKEVYEHILLSTSSHYSERLGPGR